MTDAAEKINFQEAEFFYKSEHAMVDYSQMQTFSLIKSCIELFAYYDVKEITPKDIRSFFERLALVQQKNGRVFVPSEKKINGVLECCMTPGECYLSFADGTYHIEAWNCEGYRFEIMSAKERGYIPHS